MKTVYKHMPLQCISPNTYFRTHRRVIGKRIFAFEVASPSPLATVLSPSLQAFAQTHFPHTTHFWHSIFGDLQAFAVVVVDPSLHFNPAPSEDCGKGIVFWKSHTILLEVLGGWRLPKEGHPQIGAKERVVRSMDPQGGAEIEMVLKAHHCPVATGTGSGEDLTPPPPMDVFSN